MARASAVRIFSLSCHNLEAKGLISSPLNRKFSQGRGIKGVKFEVNFCLLKSGRALED